MRPMELPTEWDDSLEAAIKRCNDFIAGQFPCEQALGQEQSVSIDVVYLAGLAASIQTIIGCLGRD